RKGARAKINPPLRPRQEVERLWDLLRMSRVDFITTAHVGWSRARKDVASIFSAKSGVPGLELFLPLMFDEAVRRRGLPTSQLVRMMSENPARRLGLWPRKGGLLIGADADLVAFDAERRWRVDEGRLVTPCGWSPYHGRGGGGAGEAVLIRGREGFAPGRGVAAARPGRWGRA